MDILERRSIEANDPEVFATIAGEERRQKRNLEADRVREITPAKPFAKRRAAAGDQ